MQASFDPLLLALSINPQHASYRLLKHGRAFSVNVLKKGQRDLAEHYGRPAPDKKLAGTELTTDRMGLPLLADALAWFECQVLSEYPAGDHVLVLGKVIGGKLIDAEAEPMSYRETGDMDGASALFPDEFFSHDAKRQSGAPYSVPSTNQRSHRPAMRSIISTSMRSSGF
jgi:flavin reductase (DIM6/NTAB) family NADH-FMN oxidoreductase RutF